MSLEPGFKILGSGPMLLGPISMLLEMDFKYLDQFPLGPVPVFHGPVSVSLEVVFVSLELVFMSLEPD